MEKAVDAPGTVAGVRSGHTRQRLCHFTDGFRDTGHQGSAMQRPEAAPHS